MFELTETERKKLSEWLKEHDKTCHFAKPENCGAIGGRHTFCFTPTSLGQIKVIKCACGKECDLSDYDW